MLLGSGLPSGPAMVGVWASHCDAATKRVNKRTVLTRTIILPPSFPAVAGRSLVKISFTSVNSTARQAARTVTTSTPSAICSRVDAAAGPIMRRAIRK